MLTADNDLLAGTKQSYKIVDDNETGPLIDGKVSPLKKLREAVNDTPVKYSVDVGPTKDSAQIGQTFTGDGDVITVIKIKHNLLIQMMWVINTL